MFNMETLNCRKAQSQQCLFAISGSPIFQMDLWIKNRIHITWSSILLACAFSLENIPLWSQKRVNRHIFSAPITCVQTRIQLVTAPSRPNLAHISIENNTVTRFNNLIVFKDIQELTLCSTKIIGFILH